MSKQIKITVVGSGYVGMSLSILLAQYNEVVVLDIDPIRVNKINNNQSTIIDKDIDLFLANKSLSLSATLDKKDAYLNSDYVIIATPTNYDSTKKSFDTDSLDGVIKDALAYTENALIIIKSTIPIGYTECAQENYGTDSIIFSPEFLREGHALNDNLFPSRIIVGSKKKAAKDFALLLIEASKKDSIETLFMGSAEAEAIKLFSNSYLAMRIAFFNELDSYACFNALDAKKIIQGVCLDDRIGMGYNNPSFGYGGYCLPKDTKQLRDSFNSVPNTLIKAVVDSNDSRIDFLADMILEKKPNVLGVFLLAMKSGSDNIRSSSTFAVLQRLIEKRIEIIVYEPLIAQDELDGIKIVNDLDFFKQSSELIIANRMSDDLLDVHEKVLTRDIFNVD